MTALAGRVVLVTGAARGLGAAYARHAAAAGARLVLNDLDGAALSATAGPLEAVGEHPEIVVGPVDDPETGKQLTARALSRFGRLDGVVANAGVMQPSPTTEDTVDNYVRHLQVNVVGVVATVLPAIPAMTSGSSIVLITSGARLGLPGVGAYAASKGAVASLCWSWAAELADRGIRVNALSPVAATDMFGQAVSKLDGPPAPEVIAPAVTFLLSDRAAGITGQVVRFTGRSLGLYPTPAHLGVEVVGDGWTYDEIAAAFDTRLGQRLADIAFGADLVTPTHRAGQS